LIRKPDKNGLRMLENRISQAVRAGFNELQSFSEQCNDMIAASKFEH